MNKIVLLFFSCLQNLYFFPHFPYIRNLNELIHKVKKENCRQQSCITFVLGKILDMESSLN